MLWFNIVKDVGALRTDDGERIDVPGAAFASGEKPSGRCVGKEVEFELFDDAVRDVAFIPQVSARRARMRHRR